MQQARPVRRKALLRRGADAVAEKPAVIVALGSATMKRFVPGLKGGVTEVIGKTFYDPTLDATIVCGINAQQVHFDPDKQEVLDGVFAQVADILS